ADQQGKIGVAINHRIEEGAKERHAVGFAGNAAIHHIEKACTDDDKSGREELALSQHHGAHGINDEAEKREDVRMNPRQLEPSDDQHDDLDADYSDTVCNAH